jgi:hypothetical protein
MKLHLIIYNVSSLNLEEEICKVRLYNQSLTSHVNIILFQEHNHRGDEAANLGKLVSKETNNSVIEASLRYWNLLDGHDVGRRGTYILLNAK